MSVIPFKAPAKGAKLAKLIDPDIDETKTPWRWYLIRVKPGHWRSVRRDLRRAGFRAVMIMERQDIWHHRHKRPEARKRPALDRYLFLRMPALAPNWYKLHEVPSVEGVMTTVTERGGVVPFRIPWRVIAKLLRRQREGNFDFSEAGAIRRGELKKGKHAKLRQIFKPGARVKVKEGAFWGFEAAIDKVAENGSIETLIQIFGRETPVSFSDPAQIELIEPAA